MNKINISIDDMSPHPLSSTDVLDKCYRLIDDFPSIKFTMFIPMCYHRLEQIAYPLNKYKDFCNILKNLPEGNFELGWHGFNHGVNGISNNDEFASLNYEQSVKIINDMFKMAEDVGIRHKMKPIFRPPAFRMSPSSFKAFEDCGIRLLALTNKSNIKPIYEGNDIVFSKKNKVVFYNVLPPCDPIKIYSITEMVFHACQWLDNYLSCKMVDKLITVLHSGTNIEFCFIEDL